MLILITRHKKVFFKNIFLSNKEHDVMTSKTPFISLLPRECMSRIFIENFVHVCNANTSTDKSAF